MPDREKTIKRLEHLSEWLFHLYQVVCDGDAPYYYDVYKTVDDAIDLLKEQEGHVSVPFSWLVKFCTHIDFKEPVTDEERELLWKQKLRQQFGIEPKGVQE